jgi:T5SS/PEP-CTERM-associated repeat protein/autotransporter-associated beta strand protein
MIQYLGFYRSGTVAGLYRACQRRSLVAFAILGFAAQAGMSPSAAVAADLIVNSGTTTISDAQTYDNTTVAENSGDTATLEVTTAGTLTNLFIPFPFRGPSGELFVGRGGTGTLNVTGGLVTNDGYSYLGYSAGSVGTATVSSGTWQSSNIQVGGNGTGTLTVTGGGVTNGGGVVGKSSVGTATVSGGTWANSGDLVIGDDENSNGTLNVTGGLVTSPIGVVGYRPLSFGTVTVSSGTWANSDYLSVGNDGSGTLNITGGSVTSGNGYLGYTAGAFGTATVSSGTWANSGNLVVGVSGTGTLNISGTGLVSVGGTLSRGAAGTISLNSGGTLQIGTGGAGGVLGVSTLTNNGTLVFNRSDDSDYSGIISGTGAVTKQGGGTLTLTGTSNYTGATAVNGGSLLVNGRLGNTTVSVGNGALLGGSGTIDGMLTVLAGGTLSPGTSPGTLHVGSLQLSGSSTTLMEITGTAAGLYDQIVAMNNIAYGGLLQLTMSGSYANGTVFQLFQFGSESGDFSSLTMAGGSGPYAGLTFGAIGTEGYGADAWVSDWTTPSAPDGQRLVFYQNTGVLAVVPEPSTYAMALAGLAYVGWQMMRRRRRRAPTLAA